MHSFNTSLQILLRNHCTQGTILSAVILKFSRSLNKKKRNLSPFGKEWNPLFLMSALAITWQQRTHVPGDKITSYQCRKWTETLILALTSLMLWALYSSPCSILFFLESSGGRKEWPTYILKVCPLHRCIQ